MLEAGNAMPERRGAVSELQWQPARLTHPDRWCERARNHPSAKLELAIKLTGTLIMISPYQKSQAICGCPTFIVKDYPREPWVTLCQVDTD